MQQGEKNNGDRRKIIYVYDDFSEDSPCLIGKLYVGVIKGGETYSFEYDADWLAKNKMRVSLDPQLQPFTGRQFPTGKIFLACFRMRLQTGGDVCL